MTEYLTPFYVHVDATFIAWVLAGFLVGGAPASYFIVRIKGHDLASEGAAPAGFSAVAQVFGVRWASVALVADASKAALLVWAALRFQTYEIAGWTAVATLLGYQWPIWTRLRGGRGLMLALAMSLPLGLWEGWIVLAMTVAARLLARDAAPGTFFGLLALLAVNFSVRAPGSPQVFEAMLAGLLLSARVIGFRPTHHRSHRSMLRRLATRLVFDRDTVTRLT